MPGTLIANDRSPATSASRTAPQTSRLTRSWASAVEAARWGVRITPGSCRSTESAGSGSGARSEEHTSELQSRFDLVCRLLLEKKKKQRHKKSQRNPCTHLT